MKQNKGLLLAIAAFILVGFGVEFIKGFQDLGTREGNRLEASDFANVGGRNFVRASRDGDNSYAVNTNKSGFKLSGIENGMGEYDANGPKAKGKGKGKLKKKKKKKKKKAKKKSAKGTSEYAVEVYEERKRPDTNSSADSTNDNTGSYTPFAEEENDTSEYDKWANLLLVRPDRSETLNFISEYQSARIQVATFYQLVNEMFAKDIDEFKSLAILAAGAAPSMQSYNFLTDVYTGDSASNIKSQASAELRDYNSMQYLWIPRSVLDNLQSQDPIRAQIAATSIDLASASYLTPRPSRASSSDTQAEPAAPGVRTEYKSYFTSMLPALELALERYRNSPEVATPLTNALNRIKQLDVVAFNEEF